MEERRPAGKSLVTEHCHSHGDAHVSWDEETIARHNLDRGTRMKIDEPNTPYHYYNDAVSPARSFSGREEQPSLQWDELQSKLQDYKDSSNTSARDNSADEKSRLASTGLQFSARNDEGKKIEKDPDFAEKRKNHYKEFERVRAWKMQHGDDDDQEDEVEGSK
ncbi:uncharacterized protein CCR75_006196 [Bremia lactucae]|uniref:Protein phosphatase inhibitor 2 n=1 Tax=Bremia lactucae TaxID=4779 RepID=A0A976IBY6_BRELC|nr:hypothetical protein CCR75_006196 [Bremia lactucae]